MRSCSIVWFAAAFNVFGAHVAVAADLPPAGEPYRSPALLAPFNWSGLYLGVMGGYGTGKLPVKSFTGGDLNQSGGFAGGTVGINYQPSNSPLVIGIEADGAWANLVADDSITFFGITETAKSELKAIATVRARVGAAFDRTLVYATGGGAWGRNTINRSVVGFLTLEDTKNHTGFAAGAGVEQAFDRWSIKVEYLYLSFGSERYLQNTIGSLTSGDVKFHTGKVGLNYRFGS